MHKLITHCEFKRKEKAGRMAYINTLTTEHMIAANSSVCCVLHVLVNLRGTCQPNKSNSLKGLSQSSYCRPHTFYIMVLMIHLRTIFISRSKVHILFQKICSMVNRNFALCAVFGDSTHLVIQPMCYYTGCMHSYNQSDRTMVIEEGLMAFSKFWVHISLFCKYCKP